MLILEVTDEKSRIRIRKANVRAQESEPDPYQATDPEHWSSHKLAYLCVLNVACFTVRTCIPVKNNCLSCKYYLSYLICLDMLYNRTKKYIYDYVL
jgi:hypothetical protein